MPAPLPSGSTVSTMTTPFIEATSVPEIVEPSAAWLRSDEPVPWPEDWP